MPAAEPPPAAEQDALYLNVGTVNTDALANLLGEPGALGDATKTCVIQLDRPITPEIRDSLTRSGILLGDYLPRHAYASRLDAASLPVLAAMPFVRWVGEFESAWKLDPALGRRQYVTADRRAMANRGELAVVVTLFANRAPPKVLAAIRAVNGAVVHYVETVAGNVTISATIPAADAAGLAQLDSVQYIEEAPELTYRNSTNRWIVQSNVTNVTPLYNKGIRGEGQIVGVLDGKADQQHCSLSGGKILFYNTSDGNDTHGTHVSCTAVGDAGVFDNTRGVAYLAKMVYNTLPSFTEASVVQRLSLHHSQGARLHTNSWGDDGTTSYNSLARGFDAFLHANEDNLVCLAVTNLGNLRNPENAKNLLAVGASQDAPSQANHCSGGAGPTADGRRKPEIYAPGCGTTSAFPSACSTTNLTGTSMASPAVTGTGALVRQYYVDGYHPTGAANPADAFIPTGALIKATLLNSAVDMTGVAGYPSNTEGWGRVIADNALYFAGDARRLAMLDDVRNASGLSTGQFVEQTFNVMSSAQRLEVTVVWTDPPASASTGTGFAAVNDLDLEVVSPGGTLYRGNVFSGGASVSGGTKDNRNNVEQVHVNSPPIGLWTARIRAAAVNQGAQGYALIATGSVVPQLPVLSISLPNGTPNLLAPGVPSSFDVIVSPGTQNVMPGSPALLYRYDGGVFQAAALTPLGGDQYSATLPAAACGDVPEFYLRAEGDGGAVVTVPANAPSGVFAATVGVETTLFHDDFETNQGWVVQNVSLTDGAWDRGVPVNCGRGDPPSDFDGSGQCYLTDNSAAANCNSDVDGGPTRLISPPIDLSAATDPMLTYARWFTNDDVDLDRLVVEISPDNGISWFLIESVPDSPGWIQRTVRILTHIPLAPAVRLRFSATDNPNNSVTEAGLDAVSIVDFVCNAPPCTRGDINDDGRVDALDIERFTTVLITGMATPIEICAGDLEPVPDGTVDLDDVPGFVDCLLAAGCP